MLKSGKSDHVVWVYTKYIRLRNGRIIYARDYGLKAFRFQAQKQRQV